ncbi:MAG: ribosomal protein methyltransferase [Candidatus Atribacteria bacterium]|nr:ribosomal protein methyltransferase [Candidatus Atribacteria bacterium]
MVRKWWRVTLNLHEEEERESVLAWFADKNPQGFWEKEGGTLIVYLPEPLLDLPPSLVGEWSQEEEWEENWVRRCQKNFPVVKISQRVSVRPPWRKPTGTEVEVVIYPALAFGTGDHPTTRGCLWFIEKYLAAGMDFLDVGAGSGILSILAVRLGAKKVVALDIDSLAMEEIKRNLRLNAVPLHRVERIEGDLSELGERKFDLIAVNVGLGFQLESLPRLREILQDRGYLVLSGFEASNCFLLEDKARSLGFYFWDKREEQDWMTVVFRR